MQEKLSYECIERGIVMQNIKKTFIMMMQSYENLIE